MSGEGDLSGDLLAEREDLDELFDLEPLADLDRDLLETGLGDLFRRGIKCASFSLSSYYKETGP